jgi:hypothetical protein
MTIPAGENSAHAVVRWTEADLQVKNINAN